MVQLKKVEVAACRISKTKDQRRDSQRTDEVQGRGRMVLSDLRGVESRGHRNEAGCDQDYDDEVNNHDACHCCNHLEGFPNIGRSFARVEIATDGLACVAVNDCGSSIENRNGGTKRHVGHGNDASHPHRHNRLGGDACACVSLSSLASRPCP